MRILLLTPALPYPPHQGGALRNHGLLHTLADAGHDVTLLSFHDNTTPVEGTPLPRLCAGVFTVAPPVRRIRHRLRDLITSDKPDLARRLDSSAFADKLRTLLNTNRFDLIQFEGLEMAIYLPIVRALQPGARTVYDAHNAEYALQAAIARVESHKLSRAPAAVYSQIQARRIARFEREVCRQADAVIAVSDEDADQLRAFRADQTIFVVPNGIFVDDYADTPAAALDLGANALVFTGKMDYRPNVDAMQWFVSAILPRIRAGVPDAKLYIVGQKPHASLQSFDAEQVAVTGWVEQVQPFLYAAAVYVAPLRMGSGTRLKLLEAMGAGRAIVATSAAAAGLHDDARDAMCIADDDAAFADAVIRLLNNPAERHRLGDGGRNAARQHYDWSALAPRLFDAYRALGVLPVSSVTR
ncbi:MAG: glycosyltransferase [Chloroflexota bacterium]|nr:glycosyltransferase [Chloroflexota bacterium]